MTPRRDNLSRRPGTNERSQIGTVAGVFIHEQSLLLVFTKTRVKPTRVCGVTLSSVRLQGAEGVTFGNEDTSNRTNESESANLPNISESTHQRGLSSRVTSDCVRTQTHEAITAALEIVWFREHVQSATSDFRVRSAVQVKRFFTFIQHELILGVDGIRTQAEGTTKDGKGGKAFLTDTTAFETHVSLAWSACVTLSSRTLGLSVVVAL